MPELPSGYTSTRRLCDDEGMVSQARAEQQPWGDDFLTYLGQHNRLAQVSGHQPIYEPFPCTGSAHLAGEHIYCTSSAHEKVWCYHCGDVGPAGSDHTCPCPYRDEICPVHPAPLRRVMAITDETR